MGLANYQPANIEKILALKRNAAFAWLALLNDSIPKEED